MKGTLGPVQPEMMTFLGGFVDLNICNLQKHEKASENYQATTEENAKVLDHNAYATFI